MKTTTTLMDILQGELHRSGKREFYESDQLHFFDDDFAFIQKVMNYDPDVRKIVDRIFFRGYKFPSDHADVNFKKSFVNRFLNREIAFQTVEVFSARVVSKCINQETYITECFDKLDDFINDVGQSKTSSESTTKSDATDTQDRRELDSDLPANNINLNVDDTVLDYGNQNNISRNKGVNNATSNTISNSQTDTKKADIDSLQKANKIIEMIFDDFDKDCFLQVW